MGSNALDTKKNFWENMKHLNDMELEETMQMLNWVTDIIQTPRVGVGKKEALEYFEYSARTEYKYLAHIVLRLNKLTETKAKIGVVYKP